MRTVSTLVLLVALTPLVFATDGVAELDPTCATPTECVSGGTAGSTLTLPVPYALGAGSAWLEGCIVGPCLCPVLYHDDLTGSFELVELPTTQPGPWRLFEVRDVKWTFTRGDTRVEISGSGTYRTAAPVLDQHRIVLDLARDGVSIGTLDSGDVPGALSFPAIEIQALTPALCVQQGPQLAAKPVPEPDGTLMLGAGIVGLFAGTRARRPAAA